MVWEVIQFESLRGEKYVKEFIDKQNSAVKAKFIGMVDFLERYGPFLSGKFTKKIRKDLYELRVTGKEQVRVLYTVRQQEIILIHAFKKKAQKIPPREIETALLRLDKISHI